MRRLAPLVALVAMVSGGCATKQDVQTLEATMREELREFREDQARLVVQLMGAVDSLEAAEGRRDMTGRGEFERRIRVLEDQIAELLDLVGQNHQLLRDLYASRSAGRPGAPVGGTPVAPPVEATPTGAGDEATQVYALALEQLRLGNNGTARGAFEDFLATYPRHELAPDAQYYLAETYAAEGDQGMALAEYQRVMELFPDSRRAPSSLLRRAMIEKGRGNLAVARTLLRQIEAGYPNSPEAPQAREELQKIGG